ncbi:protein phosphatase 1 regulatory subunit 27 [Methylophilaceae bacterium]|nr:protein phosphatase 1 regulatory subunit 27 [Methylophilaceae bacterium]
MKMIKALVLAAAMVLPLSAFAALTDEHSMEYTQAIEDNNVKVVKKYLDNGEAGINDLFFAWTALQIAANKGQLKIVEELVNRGADMNIRHPVSKLTAFHLAALNGHADVVKYLAAKGADINIKMRADVSILRPLRDEGKTEMVKLLMDLGVKDDGCQDEKCF